MGVPDESSLHPGDLRGGLYRVMFCRDFTSSLWVLDGYWERLVEGDILLVIGRKERDYVEVLVPRLGDRWLIYWEDWGRCRRAGVICSWETSA